MSLDGITQLFDGLSLDDDTTKVIIGGAVVATTLATFVCCAVKNKVLQRRAKQAATIQAAANQIQNQIHEPTPEPESKAESKPAATVQFVLNAEELAFKQVLEDLLGDTIDGAVARSVLTEFYSYMTLKQYSLQALKSNITVQFFAVLRAKGFKVYYDNHVRAHLIQYKQEELSPYFNELLGINFNEISYPIFLKHYSESDGMLIELLKIMKKDGNKNLQFNRSVIVLKQKIAEAEQYEQEQDQVVKQEESLPSNAKPVLKQLHSGATVSKSETSQQRFFNHFKLSLEELLAELNDANVDAQASLQKREQKLTSYFSKILGLQFDSERYQLFAAHYGENAMMVEKLKNLIRTNGKTAQTDDSVKELVQRIVDAEECVILPYSVVTEQQTQTATTTQAVTAPKITNNTPKDALIAELGSKLSSNATGTPEERDKHLQQAKRDTREHMEGRADGQPVYVPNFQQQANAAKGKGKTSTPIPKSENGNAVRNNM